MAFTVVTTLWTVFLFSQVSFPTVHCQSQHLHAFRSESTGKHTGSQLSHVGVQARTFVVAGTIAQWYYSSSTDRERKVRLQAYSI